MQMELKITLVVDLDPNYFAGSTSFEWFVKKSKGSFKHF